MLRDVSNQQPAIVRRRLSDILRLPPTPRRTAKHRNYTKQYHPVMTAGERLEEIREKENQKIEVAQQKKRKAIEREETKKRKEEAKRAKIEERERKRMEKKLKSRNVTIKKERRMVRD